MAQTTPPAVTTLPAAPATTAPATFASLADAFVAALATFRSELVALGTNVYNNAVDCFTNATAAAASATSASASATAATAGVNAVAWVNGGTYALNAASISQLDFQTYRKITASSVTSTDPKNDSTNWTKLTGDSSWIRKTTTYTAVDGDKLRASTTAGAWSLTAPATPSDAATFRIKDINGTFHTNNLTILCNGKNIMGFSTSYVANTRYLDAEFVFDSTLNEWRL